MLFITAPLKIALIQRDDTVRLFRGRFVTVKTMNIDVELQLWHFLRWECMVRGLSQCPCGKMAVAKINWALWLITEGISFLDLWKYANSMLICTSNYVLFDMWQSGTFTLPDWKIYSVRRRKNDSGHFWETIWVKTFLFTVVCECFRCSFLW